jgi:hypothetical protein
MNGILNKTIVLVLNRNWQAIHVRTPQEAFCMMATNVATALEIDGDDHIRPVTWDEWITLPVRPQDNPVQTVRGPIRVPTVIVAVNFAKVPRKRPKLCAKTIRERDDNRCQYTGRRIRPGPQGAALEGGMTTFQLWLAAGPKFTRIACALSWSSARWP